MLISVRKLIAFWHVRPTGVLHIGAHEAEELDDYESAKWSPVLWVEALPDKAIDLKERLRNAPGHKVVSALVWDTDGRIMNLSRTNNGQSTSALPMGTHLSEHPTVRVIEEIPLKSSRLDTLLAGVDHKFDFVNVDIQGAELRALRGLGDRIEGVRWIYCEVNEKPLYVGAELIGEIDAFLAKKGFRRVDTEMTSHGWGDALYARADVQPSLIGVRQSLRRFLTRVEGSRIARKASSIMAMR